MAEGKKSAVIYCDLITTVEKMKDVDAGKLFKHFLRYINDLNPTEPNQIVGIVFEPIKQQLKRDLKKWEKKSAKNSEIAKDAWNKRKDANASNGIKKDAKNTDNVNDTVNVTVNDTVTVTSYEVGQFFKDLENSTVLETLAMKFGLTVYHIKNFIPGFRVKAELSYPDYKRFVSHFKNYINTEINAKLTSKTGNSDRATRQESVENMENLALRVLGADDSSNS